MSKEKTSGGGGGGGKPPSAGKVTTDRRTAEKDRRTRMKDLCTGLFSLLPPQHFTTSKVISISLSKRHVAVNALGS